MFRWGAIVLMCCGGFALFCASQQRWLAGVGDEHTVAWLVAAAILFFFGMVAMAVVDTNVTEALKREQSQQRNDCDPAADQLPH